MKSKKFTILIIPELEGKRHSFKLTMNAFRMGLAGVGVLAIFFVIIIITWGSMMKRASIADRLAEENAKYEQERQRVIDLETRVKQLQQFEDQIRRVLGSDYRAESPPSAQRYDESREGALSSTETTPDTAQIAATPVAIPRSLTQFADQSIVRGTGTPSLWPVVGFISRGFEWNPIVPDRSHSGVDIAGKEGAVIRATADGIVIWSGWSARYGNLLIIAHSSGYYSVYGHNQVILVQSRQRVERGEPICLLGNTGQSTAPHLHFEVWFGNQPIDPIPLLTSS
jgi:murein DD-endopeptidase MepM/ murein hydrolase activator NlpD